MYPLLSYKLDGEMAVGGILKGLMLMAQASSALANNSTILRVLEAFDWSPDS